MKIVLVSIPNSGHLTPLSHIAVALKERGHDVTGFTMDSENGRSKGKNSFESKGIKMVYHGRSGAEAE